MKPDIEKCDYCKMHGRCDLEKATIETNSKCVFFRYSFSHPQWTVTKAGKR